MLLWGHCTWSQISSTCHDTSNEYLFFHYYYLLLFFSCVCEIPNNRSNNHLGSKSGPLWLSNQRYGNKWSWYFHDSRPMSHFTYLGRVYMYWCISLLKHGKQRIIPSALVSLSTFSFDILINNFTGMYLSLLHMNVYNLSYKGDIYWQALTPRSVFLNSYIIFK